MAGEVVRVRLAVEEQRGQWEDRRATGVDE
jgi:hypothetical protein